MAALATKTQSQNIFAKLKGKAANKVGYLHADEAVNGGSPRHRYVSTAAPGTRHGALSPLASICAWTARRTTGTWASTFRLCGPRILIVRSPGRESGRVVLTCTVWQWDQLRIMKVGGNESATKYFQSHGGSAALASKDPKTKYTSNAATKYKEELQRRCVIDARQYPDEVVITDVPEISGSDGNNTPAGDDDDFFSSWDKPTIKRPSNPPSRTGTPRAQSPFLKPGSNGDAMARPKSPLAGTSAPATPAAIPSAKPAVRKTTTGAAPKKNILGAKKKGLGAKKVVASDGLDFEEAERKAREEAERVEKLGYDPEEEAAEAAPVIKSKGPEASNIASPSTLSPSRGGFGTTAKPERSSQEMERLGMGVARLGFGQVGGGKKAAAPKKMGGFGSVGKPANDDNGEKFAREKFGTQKSISSDEFFGRNNYDPAASAQAKERLGGMFLLNLAKDLANRYAGFEGATAISSNAYFGRPEDEVPEDDYGDLESAAKDFVRKFGITASDDLDNLTSLLGEGATRLQGAVRNYLNS
jgi:ADP-ribosylation factor GTPase-activating protein 2/3